MLREGLSEEDIRAACSRLADHLIELEHHRGPKPRQNKATLRKHGSLPVETVIAVGCRMIVTMSGAIYWWDDGEYRPASVEFYEGPEPL